MTVEELRAKARELNELADNEEKKLKDNKEEEFYNSVNSFEDLIPAISRWFENQEKCIKLKNFKISTSSYYGFEYVLIAEIDYIGIIPNDYFYNIKIPKAIYYDQFSNKLHLYITLKYFKKLYEIYQMVQDDKKKIKESEEDFSNFMIERSAVYSNDLEIQELQKKIELRQKKLDAQVNFKGPEFEAEKYWGLFGINPPYWRK
jgi:hypothetical protein